jgi:cytochrome c oxidase subunit 1
MSTLGSGFLGIGFLLPAYYLSKSLASGRKASANPWGAHGLEWEIPSPPPSTNFLQIPIVLDEVYDFDPVTEYEQDRAQQAIESSHDHPGMMDSHDETASKLEDGGH